jgi:ABC-2 type transport system ATP-binding protein
VRRHRTFLNFTDMTDLAIRTENLRRTYKKAKKNRKDPDAPKEFVALDGVSLEVPPGELFGLLGPNGAGKTTLIKILTTLLAPSEGNAWVAGHEVVKEAHAIRPKINMVSGGESSGYGILTVSENLWLFARIYGVATKDLKERIAKMLELVGLGEKANARLSHLSTGQRQKMNFCRGFLTDPTILFLDEPTLGLDVTSARAIRKYLKEWMQEDRSRTLLLTTHYMAEADELCDRLAIIDKGKVLALDTPANLKRRVQQHSIFELSLAHGSKLPDLAKLPGVFQAVTTETPNTLEVKVLLHEESAIGTVVTSMVGGGARILNLKKTEPTLEDVFIELVGHGLTTS